MSTLKKKGASFKYRQQVAEWEQQIDNSGSLQFKLDSIDKETWDKFNEMRTNLKSVSITDLRLWAIDAARFYNHPDFIASPSWLSNFKKKHRISQRKVTKFVLCPVR